MSKSLSRSRRYDGLLDGIAETLNVARRVSTQTVNALMTAAYWETGRRLVEFELKGSQRALYGKQVLARLSDDLTQRFGRGFSSDNIESMRKLYLTFPREWISETLSRKSGLAVENPALSSSVNISETVSRKFDLEAVAACFPLRQLARSTKTRPKNRN